MAKDGTNRGGIRVGAGRKRKSLEEKILDGQLDAHDTSEEQFDTKSSKVKIKPPKKYLIAEQISGGKLYSEQIYNEVWDWIIARGCKDFVPKQLVENFAQVTARHIQCDEYLSALGLVAPHPTTGEPIASPFYKMGLDYIKVSSQLWYQIYSIVRENASKGMIDNDQSSAMDALLRRVK